LKITGELLNMTQVESGNIKLTLAPTDGSKLIENAIEAVRSQAEKKNIAIHVSLPTDLPAAKCDLEKTTWVLKNILANAVQYSYDNAAIDIRAFQQHDTVCFAIKDGGQGIEQQYLEKIFERYYRVPGTQKEGSGLGLAISKELITAQGGTISVQSDYGAGSEFTVCLPVGG